MQPEERTEFVSDWDECTYLLEQTSYWFWEVEDAIRSSEYALRLKECLGRISGAEATQRGAEGAALIAAIRQDWDECLRFKRKEIDAIMFLLADGVDPSVADGLDLVVAAEEFALFARDAGRLELARMILDEVRGHPLLDDTHREVLDEVARDL